MAQHPAAAAHGLSLQAQIDGGSIRAIQVRVVVLCALVTFVEGIDLTLIPLLAPQITDSWSLQSTELGTIFFFAGLGLIFGGLGVGWLADRIGRRGAVLAAMLLMTSATLATAWVTTKPELLVCRFLAGIAFGGVVPAAVALVSEFLPQRIRPSIVALVILGQAVGALVAGLLLKLPFADGRPWQTLVLYTGFACGAVMLIVFALLPESPRYLGLRKPGSARLASTLRALRLDATGVVHEPEAAVQRWRLTELFAPGRAWGTALIWATFIGVGWPLSFFTNWLTKMSTEAGFNGVDAMNLYSTGAILGGLVLPLFSRRFHHDWVLFATLLTAAVVTFALGLTLHREVHVHMSVAFLCGIFVSGAFFLLYPPAVRFYPTDIRSTGVGAAVAFGRIGNTFSPKVAGVMLGAGLAPQSVFWAMGAPLLMSCLTLYLFHRHTRAGTQGRPPAST